MSDQVGSGQVAIEPNFVGFRSKVKKEVETSGREGGRTFGSAFKGALVGLGAIVGLGKLKETFTGAIQGAGNLEQSVGGVQAVFKESSAGLFEYAKDAKTNLGLTANNYQELATIIGSQLKNGGIAMDKLAPKTQELIGLGGDLSAQFGGSTKEAVEALSSAIKGERDPIERYGVSLNQAKIDAEALALGFKKGKAGFDTQAQQAATLSLVMKQTADAQGAAARETNSFNSRQATFNAIIAEGKAKVAGAFLPALSTLFGFMNEKLPGAFDKASLRAAALGEGLSSFLAKLSAFQAGIASGAMTPDLVKALGMDPASGFGKHLATAIGGIRAFKASFEAADGDITSSGFAGFMEQFGYNTRLALDNIKAAAGPAFDALKSGDFSQLRPALDGFLSIAKPAGPILVEVGKALGKMSEEIGKLIAGALPLIKPLLEGATQAMTFLAEHTEILTAIIIAVAAGMVIWRLAQIAGNIAALASVPVMAAQAASNFALASAMRGATAAQATNTVATTAGTTSRVRAVALMVATGVATAAMKVAQLAGAAALGIATAAQWAWNAAMSANPIALVILAIVALVAGLIWFFTQTELGRQIFANVFAFIQGIVQGLIDWFNNVLVPTLAMVWAAVGAGLAAVGQFFADTWNNVIGGVGGFLAGLMQFFYELPGKILEALGNLGTLLLDAGKALIQGFIDGIKGMVSGIGDAVGGVLDFAKSFFPHSPAKRGPFSGSGYTSHSGKALATDFADSIAKEQGTVGAAASKLMTAAALTGTVTTSSAAAGAGGLGGGAAPISVTMPITERVHPADLARALDNRLNKKMRRLNA
ncbi:hypothetical protein [Arthrobacter sp. UYCu712]|uniref:phage tail protein n=1 Tax=Arthrobacter sp. UYCu712 TaxID=3156340 RepID=UPI003397119F